MSLEGQSFYPGENASPEEILILASQYRRAADALLETGCRGKPLSWAPYRLVALHAIELYLNALLVANGRPAATLRKLHHDFGSRAQLVIAAKLNLRKRTLLHLHRLSETREYLVSRYDPKAHTTSHLNRLAATLAEVAGKVTALIDRTADP